MMANLWTEVKFQIKVKLDGEDISIDITDLVRIDFLMGLNMFPQQIEVLTFNQISKFIKIKLAG